MPITPEDRARQTIDRLLTDAGWLIQSRDETNINAARGVAIRQFPLKSGYGEAAVGGRLIYFGRQTFLI